MLHGTHAVPPLALWGGVGCTVARSGDADVTQSA